MLLTIKKITFYSFETYNVSENSSENYPSTYHVYSADR